MKFEKIVLDEVVRCYAVSNIVLDGEEVLLYASEDPNTNCIAYWKNDLNRKEVVWNNSGGCMSIIQIPNRENEFLAVQEFYLKVTPSKSRLIWFKYSKEKGFESEVLVEIPYLHRFGLIKVENEILVLMSIIAKEKEYKEDWRTPGQLYYGKLPKNYGEKMQYKLVLDGLFKNHGFLIKNNIVYCSSENGLYEVSVNSLNHEEWKIVRSLDSPLSEVAFSDIDNDGIEEMLTIEPFHGNTINLYKKTDGVYTQIYKYPNEIDFAHAIQSININGKNYFVFGVRRVNAEIGIIGFDNEIYYEIIESGAGPANISFLSKDCDQWILSANHTKNEAAIYKLEKE